LERHEAAKVIVGWPPVELQAKLDTTEKNGTTEVHLNEY